jgi:hypothetical protein
MTDGKDPIMTNTATDPSRRPPVDLDARPAPAAVDLYNSTWTLLEKPDRTPAETDEMIHRAHASRWHWARVGRAGPPRARRVAVLAVTRRSGARSRPWHARRCSRSTRRSAPTGGANVGPPAAYEAMARPLRRRRHPVRGAVEGPGVDALAAIDDPTTGSRRRARRRCPRTLPPRRMPPRPVPVRWGRPDPCGIVRSRPGGGHGPAASFSDPSHVTA